MKNFVALRTNLSRTKVNASGRPNEMQVEHKSKTCVSAWPAGVMLRKEEEKERKMLVDF